MNVILSLIYVDPSSTRAELIYHVDAVLYIIEWTAKMTLFLLIRYWDTISSLMDLVYIKYPGN